MSWRARKQKPPTSNSLPAVALATSSATCLYVGSAARRSSISRATHAHASNFRRVGRNVAA